MACVCMNKYMFQCNDKKSDISKKYSPRHLQTETELMIGLLQI